MHVYWILNKLVMITCTMLSCWFVKRLSRFAPNKPKQTANERDRLISCDYLRLSFRLTNGYLRKHVIMSKESEICLSITFMHLADAFIQSDLQLHSGYTFFISMCVPWELNPQPFVLLTQCSTTEPHRNIDALLVSWGFKSGAKS